jgi:hypothetical protein
MTHSIVIDVVQPNQPALFVRQAGIPELKPNLPAMNLIQPIDLNGRNGM